MGRTVSHLPTLQARSSFRLEFSLNFPSGNSDPPPPYPPSSPAPTCNPISSGWCVTWDTVHLRLEVSQWGPHIGALTSQSWQVRSRLGLVSQCPPALHPMWPGCIGSQWYPMYLHLTRQEESHLSMPPLVAQRGAQHRGLREGKTYTPDGMTSSGRYRPSGGNLLQNPTGAFTPANQVSTFSSTHLCLELSYPIKQTSWHTPSPWLDSNGDAATLAASYDTPGDRTKCDFSSSRKKSFTSPSASIQ